MRRLRTFNKWERAHVRGGFRRQARWIQLTIDLLPHSSNKCQGKQLSVRSRPWQCVDGLAATHLSPWALTRGRLSRRKDGRRAENTPHGRNPWGLAGRTAWPFAWVGEARLATVEALTKVVSDGKWELSAPTSGRPDATPEKLSSLFAYITGPVLK